MMRPPSGPMLGAFGNGSRMKFIAIHCPTPLFTAAAQFYHAGIAQGRGGQDTGAVCAVLEKLAGIERKR